MKSYQTLCPYCRHDEIYQTRREGIFEQLVSTFNIFPHCCFNCNKRFFVRSSPAIDSKSPNRAFKILPIKKRIVLFATVTILFSSLAICLNFPGRFASKPEKTTIPFLLSGEDDRPSTKGGISNNISFILPDSSTDPSPANEIKEIMEGKESITIQDIESYQYSYQEYSTKPISLPEPSSDSEGSSSSINKTASITLKEIHSIPEIKKSYLENVPEFSSGPGKKEKMNISEVSDQEENTIPAKDSKSKTMGIYPWTSTRYLNESDLENLNTRQLKIMRNEIFARHSYIFSTEAMRDYFNQQSWYSPLQKDVSNELSEIEVHNLNLLKQTE